MRKLTRNEKEHINIMTEINARTCKEIFDTCEIISKKSSFIDGIWVGLIAAGFEFDNMYDDEISKIWDKAK